MVELGRAATPDFLFSVARVSDILQRGHNAIVTLFLTLGSIILVLVAGLKHAGGPSSLLLAVTAMAALVACGFVAFLNESGLLWSGALLPLGLLIAQKQDASFGLALRLSAALLAVGAAVAAVWGVLSLPPFAHSSMDLGARLGMATLLAGATGCGTARWLQQELGAQLWPRIFGLQLMLMSLPYAHHLVMLPFEPSTSALTVARLDGLACALGFLLAGAAACATGWRRVCTPPTLTLPGGLTIIFDE